MMIFALLAALATGPDPAEPRTFRDWTVGCDNGLACEAIALLPEVAEPAEWVTMSLQREGHAGAHPIVTIQNIETEPTALLADGRPLDVRFSGSDDGFVIQTSDGFELIAAIRNAQVLEIRNAGDDTIGLISLAGATAAMLYMDEAQRRVDTLTALARPGTRPASAVPAPPALPQVRLAPLPTDRPLAIDSALVARLRGQFECDVFDSRAPDEFETEQIATGTTLVLIPCGSGAYNFSSVPYIAERRGGRIVTMLAPFDRQWGMTAEGHPVLVNPSWDPETRRLREYSKGRGLGDCGTRSEYAWDGSSFRLVHHEQMGECRGSFYYITTWRAETIGR